MCGFCHFVRSYRYKKSSLFILSIWQKNIFFMEVHHYFSNSCLYLLAFRGGKTLLHVRSIQLKVNSCIHGYCFYHGEWHELLAVLYQTEMEGTSSHHQRKIRIKCESPNPTQLAEAKCIMMRMSEIILLLGLKRC